ncbi:MAG: amino acid ABC transporter permease, partial [Desulfovibrionales bacterium]|nr:amino acid ABC transporter permease [Desulfovibrionales bacterium]
MKTHLFNGLFNSLLTVFILFLIVKWLPPFMGWALWDSVWFTDGKTCKECTGACWSVIFKNFRFIIFGFYPRELQWRPIGALSILSLLILFSYNRKFWTRKLAYAWGLGLFAMGILMSGGLFGLSVVESSKWGGLPLTLLLSIFGLAAAYPLGVILALGRIARMPIIRFLSIGYIELIRGVPLISLLFMSSIIFPLFLPEGITVNKILRAQ